MNAYVVRRLLLFIPTLFCASVIVFVAMRVVPGDVAAAVLGDNATVESMARVRAELGLDRPLALQYLDWLWRLLRLDLGHSLLYKGVAIGSLIRDAYPITITMTVYGMIISVVLALPLGTYSALKQDTVVEYIIRGFTIGGLCIPTFWLGVLVLFLCVRFLGWSPDFRYVPFFDNPWENFKAFALPAAVFAYHNVGVVARMLRSQLLEVIREDYVRTAHAKGLRQLAVTIRHALPNALLPVVTIAGSQFAAMLAGLVVVERIFALPGLGTLMITGAVNMDYVLVQSLFVMIALIVLIVNLLVDLLYGLLDPRVRFE